MPTYKKIEFTSNGYAEFEKIMVTLGSKTKKIFVDALKTEFANTQTKEHQMLNSADIIRIAVDLKLL